MLSCDAPQALYERVLLLRLDGEDDHHRVDIAGFGNSCHGAVSCQRSTTPGPWGTVRFAVEQKTYNAAAGTLVMIPLAPTTFASFTDQLAVMLSTFTPDLYVQYFRGLQEPNPPPTSLGSWPLLRLRTLVGDDCHPGTGQGDPDPQAAQPIMAWVDLTPMPTVRTIGMLEALGAIWLAATCL
ncbi:hypothetical protein [Streptomyces hokutonensis]|uniref:hypothetical protein n=1 Tax=Streptomyces hokutonensis TaxID=1306990 RepID=UPI00381995AB